MGACNLPKLLLISLSACVGSGVPLITPQPDGPRRVAEVIPGTTPEYMLTIAD